MLLPAHMTTVKNRFGLTFVMLILVMFSLLICMAIIPVFLTSLSQLTWNETGCTIQKAELAGESSSQKIRVLYDYEVNGTAYRSDQYELPSNVSPSNQELRDRVAALEPGTTAPCWYDSGQPGNAVLHKESAAMGFFLLFPAALLTAAWFGLRAAWFPNAFRRQPQSTEENGEKDSKAGLGIGIFIFFGIFILVGLGLTYLFFWSRYQAVMKTADWSETECKIQEARVESHTSQDSQKRTSTSYSVHVRYGYSVNGKQYIGTTYNPSEISSSDHSKKSQIVESLPVGEHVKCFFNPVNPFESTINRDLNKEIWFGLFPLIFSFAGFFGLFYTLTSGLGEKGQPGDGSRVKRKAQSRLTGFVSLILVNIVWNGIVCIVGYGIWDSWQHGNGPIFPLLIIAPFALIGILFIISIPYSFLQIFNPTLDLEFFPKVPEPGSQFTVSWRLSSSSWRVRKLDIVLELMSQTIPGSQTPQGKKQKLNAALGTVIHTVKVASTDRKATIEKGSAQVRIPDDDQHAPLHEKERRIWRLRTNLSIPFYPDSVEMIDFGNNEEEEDNNEEDVDNET